MAADARPLFNPPLFEKIPRAPIFLRRNYFLRNENMFVQLRVKFTRLRHG
jgi:hypothetical protein